MVLKLYGFAASTCTQRVKAVLYEKKVPFEMHAVDAGKREHKSPAFLEKQPFGQVPYIDDDGFILYESRAICRYIAAKYRDQGTPLLLDPADIKATALFEQAASVELSNFDTYATAIAIERLFKPMFAKVEGDEKVALANLETLTAKLQVYDTILSKQKYLAGNELTLADIFHLPYGSILAVVNIDILESGKFPNVTRWWKDLTGRDSWKAVTAEQK